MPKNKYSTFVVLSQSSRIICSNGNSYPVGLLCSKGMIPCSSLCGLYGKASFSLSVLFCVQSNCIVYCSIKYRHYPLNLLAKLLLSTFYLRTSKTPQYFLQHRYTCPGFHDISSTPDKTNNRGNHNIMNQGRIILYLSVVIAILVILLIFTILCCFKALKHRTRSQSDSRKWFGMV